MQPLALLLVFLAGSLVVTSADAGLFDRLNPFSSFETRCEALPPARFEVVAAPIAFVEDFSQSLSALSSMNDAPRFRRTVGLMQARIAYESTLESKGLEDRPGGRVCSRPSVRLVFSATPMTVFVAREFADDRCRRTMILEHEMRHVAVYRESLNELVERARRELTAAYGDQVLYANDARESQETMRQRLQAFMRKFMQARYAEIKARHAEIDTSEEYTRLGQACVTSPG
ncbi:MAG: hypothetical protein M3Z31_14950 [Pseudomonadota bacterium]|nr:hypothetical protein [Pseudomonadota bacterium]